MRSVSAAKVPWSLVRKSTSAKWCGKLGRASRKLPKEVGEDGFGGAAAAEHGAMDASVVSVIAAEIDAGANAYRALRRFKCAGKLLRLCVRDAIAAKKFPGTRDGAEPIFHLRDDEAAELFVGELLDAEHRDGDEGFSGGGVRGRNLGHDREIVNGAGAIAVEDEHWLRHRRFFRRIIKAGDAA